MEHRTNRVRAARDDALLDLILENIRLLNVYTGEIYPAEIGISGGYVVRVGMPRITGLEPKKRHDGGGRVAIPGLIDSHVHIESSMMSPAGFAAAVVPRGTTSLVIDPHEIANVMGLEGIRYMLEATRALSLRVFVQAPSCVPAVPKLETAGAEFGPQEIAEILSWDRVIGLAEVMDYVGVVSQQGRIREIINVALERGAIVSGHCPGLVGPDLAAYLVGGARSDHEGTDEDELLEKLRNGMSVEGRISSYSDSTGVLGNIIKRLGELPPNLVFCTDDRFPQDLFRTGHLDFVIKHALSAGFSPAQAVRAATLNAAAYHRLDELGAIAPGKRADIVLVDDLDAFNVCQVFIDGKLVAQDGRICASQDDRNGIETGNTVVINREINAEDFLIRGRPGRQVERVRVLWNHPDYSKTVEMRDIDVIDGVLDVSDKDYCLVSVIERHGRTNNWSKALIGGLNLTSGAVATTVSHDSHNLVIVGRDANDMAVAASELIRLGGGICCVDGGCVCASIPLPIAGLMSSEPLSVMAAQFDKMNQVLRRQGLNFRQPISPLLLMTMPVFPSYAITDKGLIDVEKQELVSIWADEP
jgi:adenine deaminase